MFAEAEERDFQAIEFIQYFQKVPDGPRQPIESPDQHDVELAAPGIGHHLIEPGTFRPGSRDPVFVGGDDLVATLRSQAAQIASNTVITSNVVFVFMQVFRSVLR